MNFIFVYLMLGLQVGMSRYIAFHGAAPNLGLIAVLFISLHARRDSALIGSFTIGLIQDLLTSQQPGLFAFSYGLVAMVIVTLHRSVNARHPATHMALALIGGIITMLILLIHSALHPAAAASGEGQLLLRPMRISAGVEFMRVLYTTGAAPVILVGVNRIRHTFSGRRKKSRSW